MLASKSTDARSTSGDEIKKEKVTPTGKPALVKPMNSGMLEHEQKGVMVPNSAPKILAVIPLKRPRILRVLSGGKKLWIYEIENIKTDNKMNILMTS